MIAQTARNLLSAAETNINRALGREFIPRARRLSIETSSWCNLKCRFCAYTKKESPKVSMKDEFFRDCVSQAVEMGYQRFKLTPCTGDLFMDRHIFNKLEFLEGHPAVEGYEFFTNFTIPKPEGIARLAKLKKLKKLTISIYRHDIATFVAITNSTELVYRRLVRNLEALLRLTEQNSIVLEFGMRSTTDMPRRPNSEIMQLLERFERAGIKVRRSSGNYNNWGGYITNDDVQGLPIRIKGAESVHKDGACSLLFTDVQVMATGIVNGCACRDVDATLRIGDLKEKPLREIISARNPLYMALIEEQQRGDFRPICHSCDFYKSIYHVRMRDRKGAGEFLSIQQFKDRLDLVTTPVAPPPA